MGKSTFRELVEACYSERRIDDLSYGSMARGYMRRYVLPALGDRDCASVSEADLRELVVELTSTTSRFGTVLAPRTILHIVDLVGGVFRWATKTGRIRRKPFAMKSVLESLPPIPEVKPPDTFTVAEVQALILDGRLPLVRRVSNALDTLTGMRPGEVSAFRWDDWSPRTEPLGAITCRRVYSSQMKRIRELRLVPVRVIPVHPVLAELLTQWRDCAWAGWVGRLPRRTDYVIPSRGGALRTNHEIAKGFKADLKTLGLRSRRHAMTRPTCGVLLRAAGLDDETVNLVLGDIEAWKNWTEPPDFKRVCKAVLSIPIK